MEEKTVRALDLNKMKEIVQQESARLKLRFLTTDGETGFTLALALSAAVKKIFYEKSEMTFTNEPNVEKKPVTQFVHKMRVDAMEKFNATTVFSTIRFAASQQEMEKGKFLITLMVYLENKYLPEFMRLMQYPYIDSDDEDEVRDGCGTLTNLIAGQYKREIGVLGYKDIMMSPFESYVNTVGDGVAIPYGVTEKYEISFDVEETKRLVVEMVTLSTLPRLNAKERTRTRKILVVDDDPVHLKSVEALLKSKGFEVILAHDGKEGLARLRNCPDLVLLDLQMPNMDGYEFMLALNETGMKKPPIIILTMKEGLADITNVEGVREYIVKPYDPDKLLKSLQRHL
jgi:CheY-like chemotaxis protein